MAMAPLKLYDASGKLKGTVTALDEHRHSFHPVLSASDHYAIDKDDFLAKTEAGHVWDEEAKGFRRCSFDFPATLPPLFFTVTTPPDTYEQYLAVRDKTTLLDGAFLVADERRDGRVKVQSLVTLLCVAGTQEIAGYMQDKYVHCHVAAKLEVVSVGDILCTKEYKFANPDVVWPKHKANHAMKGQNVTYQDLELALAPENLQPGRPLPVTKAGALRCLWETLGGGKVDKLAPGHKGIYLNAAITSPYQLAFLVATGYKLFSRISASNRRKDFFAVKGS